MKYYVTSPVDIPSYITAGRKYDLTGKRPSVCGGWSGNVTLDDGDTHYILAMGCCWLENKADWELHEVPEDTETAPLDQETLMQTPCPIPDIGDAVVRPGHYAKFEIEPVEFIMRNGLGFAIGNVIKYAARAGGKKYDGLDLEQSEIRDLKKAIRYLEMRIRQIEGEDRL